MLRSPCRRCRPGLEPDMGAGRSRVIVDIITVYKVIKSANTCRSLESGTPRQVRGSPLRPQNKKVPG
jgi:hypothetical protein